jgi:hypothetical protein
MSRLGATPEPSAAFEPASSRDDLVIMIPLFNDWASAQLLLAQVDEVLVNDGREARVLLIDDGSTIPVSEATMPRGGRGVTRIDIVYLRRNLGHQRAIAVGLAYIEQHVPCRVLILMDGDGEDAPSDLPKLLARFEEKGTEIIFAERTRRSETWLFVMFYNLYKLIHVVLTGQGVRVGNFSVIPGVRLKSLVVVSEVWNHYPAAVFRSRQPYAMVPTQRGHRLVGRSQMNFTRLVVHGLSAISVYSDIIGVRLLMATLVLMGMAGAGLFAVLGVRLFTTMAVPGWATNALGIMLIVLLQAAMFSVVFCFIILGSRQGSSFLPCRDFVYYIGDVSTVYDGLGTESQALPDHAAVASLGSSPLP